MKTIKFIKPEKLHALTSLRFFAAGLIVLHHSFDAFHFGTTVNSFFPTNQAVSFFFVLSGFILTYVYKSFDSPGSVRRFFLARFARVWPVHFVTLLLTIYVFSGWYTNQAKSPSSLQDFWLPLVSNLSLLQSWIPLSKFFYSFNAVSWSISTEFGFYLLFPLLLAGLNHNWPFKLAGTLTFTIAVVLLLNYLATKDVMTIIGCIGHNPLSRSFEFTSGMVMAIFYNHIKHTYSPGLVTATAIEITALFGVLAGMAISLRLGYFVFPIFGVPGNLWFGVGNSNVIFVAPFILIMALAKGRVSYILSKPVFVFLGEISFSVYLLHQIMIRAYTSNFEKFIVTPTWFTYGYFIALILLGSYILWEVIEKPCQKLILNWNKNNFFTYKKYLTTISSNKRLVLSALILVSLSIPLIRIESIAPKISIVNQKQVESMSSNVVDNLRDIHFGQNFLLKGIIMDDKSKHYVTLIWKSLKSTQLKYMVAVHFIDQQGNILTQADYYQSNRKGHQGKVRENTFWIDKIPLTNISEKVQSIAIALFTEKDMVLLPVSDGPRDWNNTRLLIPLHANTEKAIVSGSKIKTNSVKN